MWDIILECIRAVVIALILFYIWKIGKNRGLNRQKGWGFIIYGWLFVLFGSVLDITDNFESLNWLIIIGDTETEAFLEKFVGFLIGYILLFIGFLFWLPAGVKKVENLKNDFVSTVSHELRTPLTSIYGAIKIVTSGVLGEIPDRAQATLEIALRNSDRLTALVNDILDMDKLENNGMELFLKPHDIVKLVSEAVEANKHYDNKKDIHYNFEPKSVSGIVNVDSDRFNQVMNNLLSNAAKFSKPNGVVKLEITANNGFFRISVIDNGNGIEEEFLPYVFQKFSQARKTENHMGGTGLGLAISKELVEKMGGRIGFTTTVGVETIFYFELPKYPN